MFAAVCIIKLHFLSRFTFFARTIFTSLHGLFRPQRALHTPVTAHTSTALSDATNSTGPRLVQSRNERRHVCVVVMWVYPSDWSLARRPKRRRRELFLCCRRDLNTTSREERLR